MVAVIGFLSALSSLIFGTRSARRVMSKSAFSVSLCSVLETKYSCYREAEAEVASSGMSSPLTSLSSLDDSDERIPGPSQSHTAHNTSHDDEDLRAAQVCVLLSTALYCLNK
jgi:hypothetical protein